MVMALPLKSISPVYEPMAKSSLRVMVQPPLAVSQALFPHWFLS
jgi:hypothetical protein